MVLACAYIYVCVCVCVYIYTLFLSFILRNWTKLIAVKCEACNICKTKMYDQHTRRIRREKWKYRIVRFLHYM